MELAVSSEMFAVGNISKTIAQYMKLTQKRQTNKPMDR